MQHHYEFKHVPIYLGMKVPFRPLRLFEVVSGFPELLEMALPIGAFAEREAARARTERLRDETTVAGLERRIRLAARVINLAVPLLSNRVHADWTEVPRSPEGQLLPGHLHYSDLGPDLSGLYSAVLEASGLSEDRCARVRKLLGNQRLLVKIDATARRFGTTPAELLGFTPDDSLSYPVNMHTASVARRHERQPKPAPAAE